MNIYNLEKSIATSKLKNAEKIQLREIEEEHKNIFVAFADVDHSSFDIKIEIDDSGEVQNFSCECNSKGVCLHTIALLKAISNLKSKKKSTVKKTRTKAPSALEILVNSISEQELKHWLMGFLSKNKEALLDFDLNFSEQKKSFTKQDVLDVVDQAIKTVIGKRKSASATENKKIVDLLQKSFEPILSFIQINISEPIVFDIFTGAVERFLEQYYYIFDSSTRYNKFFNQLKDKIIYSIHQIKDERIWEKTVSYYWNIFFNADKLYDYKIDFIFDVYRESSIERKKIIGQQVVTKLKEWGNQDRRFSALYTQILLTIVIENNEFVQVKDFFKPKKFENNYNMVLLKELAKTEPNTSLDYCFNIIEDNYYEHFNEPYYELIEIIATNNNDMKSLAKLKKIKLHNGYGNYSDIPFIKEHLGNNSLDSFEKKLIKEMKYYSIREDEDAEYYFSLLDKKKNYTQMLEVIDRNGFSASILLKYTDKLFEFNFDKLIIVLKNRLVDLKIDISKSQDEIDLLHWMLRKYDRSYFSNLRKRTFYYKPMNKTYLFDLIDAKNK